MEIKILFLALRLALGWFKVNSLVALGESLTSLKQRSEQTEADVISAGTSPMNCNLQGTARLPVFSVDGDYIIGGVFSIHLKQQAVIHNYTTLPDPPQCTGRLVRSGGDGEWTAQ